MKNNLKLLNSFMILFAISVLCLFSAPAWSCPPPPPVAILEISPDPATGGQTVLLDGSKSIPYCASINLYQWDFTNNGSYDYYETPTYYPDGAFDGKTTCVYTNPGTYTAKLRVTNSCNLSDTDIDTVVVEEPVPVAVLEISPDPVLTGQTVLLDGSNSTSVSGNITQYEWDFTNDGVYDYYETPTSYPDGAFDGKTTHIYTDPNTYTAKLRVRNSYNHFGTGTDTVAVMVGITYTYDEAGNRISMTDSSGATSYSYDTLGRLISVTNPDDKTVSYEYDANGNRTQLTDPNGDITTYAYNGNNRLTDVNSPAGVTTYQYDSLGNLTRADLPNSAYTQYSYDPQRNWLVSLVNKEPNNAVLSSYSYTYDNTGNRLSVTENDNSVVSYGYDDIYQLTSETRTGTNAYSITYQYDPVGNRIQMVKNSVSTSYTYNNNNQLLTETAGGTTTTYTYDGNGNLVSKAAGGNTTTYTWDWNNHLWSVSASAGNTAYEYDGDGTRISKTQNSVKTKYINDVALGLVQVLMEANSVNQVQVVYAYGNGLISMTKAGENSYYHHDGLGSTRQLTDFAGALNASYTYDSFGNLIASSGTVSNTYGFTGEQQFAEVDNLIFLRARYYDPKTGRFISKDPIGYKGGLNLYAYVRNNPVIFIDLTGTKCQDASNSPEVKDCLNKLSECMKNDPIKDDVDRAKNGQGVGIQVCDDPANDLGEDVLGDYVWRPWPLKDRIRLGKGFDCSTLLHEISHFEDGYWGRWRPGKSEDKAYDYSDSKYYNNCCDK